MSWILLALATFVLSLPIIMLVKDDNRLPLSTILDIPRGGGFIDIVGNFCEYCFGWLALMIGAYFEPRLAISGIVAMLYILANGDVQVPKQEPVPQLKISDIMEDDLRDSPVFILPETE